MTDFQKFIEFYKQFGIEFEEEIQDGEKSLFLESWKSGPKIVGYYGFFTRIDFDKDGNFVEQGFWE